MPDQRERADERRGKGSEKEERERDKIAVKR